LRISTHSPTTHSHTHSLLERPVVKLARHEESQEELIDHLDVDPAGLQHGLVFLSAVLAGPVRVCVCVFVCVCVRVYMSSLHYSSHLFTCTRIHNTRAHTHIHTYTPWWQSAEKVALHHDEHLGDHVWLLEHVLVLADVLHQLQQLLPLHLLRARMRMCVCKIEVDGRVVGYVCIIMTRASHTYSLWPACAWPSSHTHTHTNTHTHTHSPWLFSAWQCWIPRSSRRGCSTDAASR
jgi:uncharacterized protein YbdZ (MbtH family)